MKTKQKKNMNTINASIDRRMTGTLAFAALTAVAALAAADTAANVAIIAAMETAASYADLAAAYRNDARPLTGPTSSAPASTMPMPWLRPNPFNVPSRPPPPPTMPPTKKPPNCWLAPMLPL